jgi:phage-related protein (TIGR01555 family)
MPNQRGRKGTWGGRRKNAGRKPSAAAQPRQDHGFEHTIDQAVQTLTADAAARGSNQMDMNLVMRVLPDIIQASQRNAKTVQRTPERDPFRLPTFPAGVVPEKKELRLAMDSNITFASQSWLAGGVLNSIASEGLMFPGYAYLAELAQRPEYRIIAETIADDSTRKFIKFEIVGDAKEKEKRAAEDAEDPEGAEERSEQRIRDAGKADKVKAIKDEFTRLGVRDKFYDLCRDDGFFGRTHLYIDLGVDIAGPGSSELRTPIGNGRDAISRAKVRRGKLRALRVIEPVWVYPTTYNASNPLAPDWYDPQIWYVMGTEVHTSRLLPFVGRPVPDMLKPAYAFGGLSLSQIAQPYVDIWLRTRQSVADMIHSFSVMVLMTDLNTILQPGNAASLIARVTLFNTLRDNQGLMLANKDSEDLKNVSASLSGLDHLQAQSQEHVASIARIPLVKYTGLQPTGLNASSEGEIRVYYDTISAGQNRFQRPNLTRVFNFVQLSLFGEVDPDLTFEFEPLWDLSAKEKSEKEKSDAERDDKYVNMGALDPAEVRARIIDDPALPYAGLDPDDVPEPPQDPGAGEGGPGAPPGPGGPQPDPSGKPAQPPIAQDDADEIGMSLLALDAEWKEEDHPRAPDGKFGSGGGGGAGGKPKKSKGKKAAAAPAAAAGSPSKPLNPKDLIKVGEKMGSNDGGTFKDATNGKKYYVKKPPSKAHVTNELLGAKLYQLAGGNTLTYAPVDGGEHVATELAKLDKKNVNDFTPEEKKAAQSDFATQAWIANWDAAGTGGDNKGILKGKPTALDFGGSLEYRAQGEPKGDQFGAEVPELMSFLDASVSPDNAKLYKGMSFEEGRLSAMKVTELTNDQIITAVKESGGTATLAEKLIARKNYIADNFGLPTDTSEWDDAKHPRNPDGTFAKGPGTFDPDYDPAAEGEAAAAAEGVSFVDEDGPSDLELDFTHTTGKTKSDYASEAEYQAALKEFEQSFEDGVAPEEETTDSLQKKHDDLLTQAANAETDEEAEKLVKQAQEVDAKIDALKSQQDNTELAQKAEANTEPEKAEASAEEEIKPGAYGGLYVTSGESPKENHALTVSKYLGQKTQVGIHYRRMLARLIKDAPAYGGQSAVEPLKKKLIESLALSAQKAFAKGKNDEGHKLIEAAKKLGGAELGTAIAAKAAQAKPAIAEAEAAVAATKNPALTKALEKAKAEADGIDPTSDVSPQQQMIKDFVPQFYNESKAIDATGAPASTTLYAKIEYAVATETATAEAINIMLTPAEVVELGKSGKSISQLMDTYKKTPPPEQKAEVKKKAAAAPPAPNLQDLFEAQAKANIEQKSAKSALYVGKMKIKAAVQVGFPADLVEKNLSPDELSAIKEKYGSVDSAYAKGQQYANADKAAKEAQAKAAQEQLKAQEEAKKKAAEQKKKEAEQAKKNAAANAEVMKELGISEKEAEGFNGLVQMLGGSTSDVVKAFKSYETKVKGYGYPISGFQGALIANYSNGGYSAVNKALRSGSWTLQQHVYAKMINKALRAMPTYTGQVQRGTTLTAADQAKYIAGNVVPDAGLMSTSISSPFGGNTKFHITAIGKRGAHIKKLSNYPSEDEVLFAARTCFKVTKVEGKPGGNMTVWMEELDDGD